MKYELFITITLLSLLVSISGCTQQVRPLDASDVSNLSVNHINFSEPITDEFRFIVYGHSYGSALDADEFPSSTLRSSLDLLDNLHPSFIVSLGDMVEKPTPQQFEGVNTMLLSKFSVPVFNSVGNHDVKDRELYESLYGSETYYSFKYANAMFILLDTEIDDCYIEGDQLDMVRASVDQALSDDSIDTIYILMHKVLYMESNLMKENETNMVRTNDLKVFSGNNFAEITDSILIPAAKKKPVHIFAGDVGAFNGNLSPYYQKDGRANLYMYASGLGDSENDVILAVYNEGKSVKVVPFLLKNGERLNIKDYDETYWIYYGKDRWEKYRPAIDFGKKCALNVCRVGKNVFHMQCRYFVLLIVIGFAGGGVGVFRLIKKKRQQK